MNNKFANINKTICYFFLLMVFYMPLMASESIQSLRGAQPVDKDSVEGVVIKWEHETDPIPRDYFSQPPLIPHRVTGYTINLKFNKCLTCHSSANYKASDATRVSPTHFYGRERKKTKQVAARQYFCLQCHVPQREAKPLVTNNFVPKS